MKKYLFEIYERVHIIVLYLIVALASIVILTVHFINYKTSEIIYGEFIIGLIFIFYVITMFFIIFYNSGIFYFSFIMIEDEEILFKCPRKKFNKQILYKDINSLYIDEFCYQGIGTSMNFSKFIAISRLKNLSKKNSKIKDNVLKLIKSRDLIIIQYNEELYQSILEKMEV